MAVINQSPLGQTSISISGIDFSDIVASGTEPFRKAAIRLIDDSPSIAVDFGSAARKSIVPASLIGQNTPVSTSSATGIFTFDDQIAAKRAGAWPI